MKRKTNNKAVWGLLALLGLGAGLGLWWRRAHAAAAEEPAASTARVTRRDFSPSVLATGAVKPQVGAEVRVGARASGKVERLHANTGDRVEQGDIVAELEKADLEATVAQRRAEAELAAAKRSAIETLFPVEIQQAQSEVDRCQATLDRTAKDLAREEDMLKRNSTSEQSRDQAREQKLVGEAQLAVASKALELAHARHAEELRQAQAECDRANAALAFVEAQLSYATITAPIAGVVGSVSTQEGETVAAGLSAPTFVTIIDLSRLQVDAFVDEVDIGKVQVGQQASFVVDSYPAEEFQGKVAAIYPKAVLQDNVVYYDVVIEIASPYENRLRPEMTANVTIVLEARQGVLAIPSKALKREGGKTVVTVMADGRPASRPIKVGWKDGDWVEVLEGLSEGESVRIETPASATPTP